MFRMHETWRRRVCRAGFVLLAAMPTAAVLLWALWHAAGWPAHEARLRVERLTGLRADAVNISFPRPGVTLFEGLALADRESGREVLRARTVETCFTGAAQAIACTQVEIAGFDAAAVQQLADRWLRAQLAPEIEHVRLTADAVTWRGPRAAQTFTDVHVRGGPLPAGREIVTHLRLAGANAGDETTLRAARRSGDDGPTTSWSIVTGRTPLPCSLLAPLVDVDEWLGTRARFHGAVAIDQQPRGIAADLAGSFTGVDLDALVSTRFPHTLSGTGDVKLERAVIRGGRIVEAAGALEAGPGAISRTLVAAGGEHLGLARTSEFLLPERTQPFERLSLGFALDERGLTLDGRCPGAPPGTLLLGASSGGAPRVMWSEPDGPKPIVALVRVLVPDNDVQVPATRQSEWLLRRLPLPPVVLSGEDGKTIEPHARLRVGDAMR